MKYQIKVTKPCHENWAKMTTTEKGKFCKSCQKEVVDFTKLSTTAISKKILANNNLCGRFKKSQLDKDIITSERSYFSKIAASLALVSVISVSEPIVSQVKKDSIEIERDVVGKFLVQKDSIQKHIIFKGNVKDEAGNLPGVNVVLKNTNISVETDFDGNFSIKIPNEKQKSLLLVFKYLGYKTQEIDILQLKKSLVVKMEESSEILGEIQMVLGMISIDKKPNIFQKTGNLFKKKENKK